MNKLTKREFLLDNQLFFKEGIIHEDEHWSYFWVRKIDCVAFVKEFTYIHPINPNSIMTSSSKDKSASNWEIIFSDFLDNIDQEYYKEQFGYCLYRFSMWYPRFGSKVGYKNLYKRFCSIAKAHSDYSSMLKLMNLYIKYTLLRQQFIRKFVDGQK